MSSPRIITFVPAPLDVARASNGDGIRQRLAWAKQIYEQTLAAQRDLISPEFDTFDEKPPMPYEEAEREAWDMFAAPGDASEALKFAHAYWQSLKHPWQERILQEQARREAIRVLKAQEEAARAEQILEEVGRWRSSNVELREARIDTSASRPEFSWAERLEEARAAVIALVPESQHDSLQKTLDSLIHLPPAQQSLALESLQLAIANEQQAMVRAETMRRYQERQREALIERMSARLTECAKRADLLETAGAGHIEQQLAQLRERLERNECQEADEDQLHELEKQTDDEIRNAGLVEAAMAELRRMGYKEVTAMEAKGPAAIRSVYVRDPVDENRVALVQVSHSAMSSEVIRCEDFDGSDRQAFADHSAQTRLCKALEAVESALATRWQLKVHSTTPPGVRLKVDKRMKINRGRAAAAGEKNTRLRDINQRSL